MTADGFVLVVVVLGGVPVAAIVGAVIGFWALRQIPPHKFFIAMALAIILAPYLLGFLIDPRDGLDLALKWGVRTIVSPLALAGLIGAIVWKTLDSHDAHRRR